MQVHNISSAVRLGATEVKKIYPEETDWLESSWRRMLRPRNQYSGPSYEWVGTTEHGLGKCFFVNSGERFVTAMPMQTVLMSMEKHTGLAISSIPGISEVASFFVSLTIDEFKEIGGSYIYLKAGQGILIPPLYMVGMLGAFQLENGPSEGESEILGDLVDT